MKQLFTILIFFFSISNISAQNYADKEYYLIDSLVLQDLSEFDSLLIEKHLKAYHADNTFHKLAHLDTIIKNSVDYFLFESYYKPYWEETRKFLEQFKEGSENRKLVWIHYANAIHTNALIFDFADESDSALFYYEQSLALYKKLEVNQSIGEVMTGIATIYKNIDGKYYEGLEMAKESFKYLDANNINTAICYRNFANYMLGQRNFEEAIIFNQKALMISRKLNNKDQEISAMTNIASIKRSQGKLEEADSIIQQTVFIMNTIENLGLYDYTFVLDELGQVLLEQKKIDTAQIVYEEILAISKDNNFIYEYIFANTALSEIAVLKADYEKSKSYGIKSYNMAKEYGLENLMGLSLKSLIAVAEYNKNYKLALEYQKEHQSIWERIENDDKKNITLKQGLKYQFEKQKEIDDLKNEQKLEIAEQQKQKTRIGMFAAGIIALLIGIFSIYTFNRLKLIRNQKNKLDKAYVDLDAAYLKLEESTKNELAASNLKALKAQMNPHFIFNLLNSIQGLVLRGDIDASYTYMTKFATLVRQTLNFSDVDLVDLEDEIDLLRIYLDLEKLRFSEDFEYHIIDNDIEDIKIPPLLIQPFIENALVHGLLHKKGSKTLKIVFELKDQLICTITDNGVGRIKSKEIKARQDVQHESFSTQAIEKRFKILSETYKGQFGFKYEDVFEGDILVATQVKLHIPFKRIF